MELFFSTTADLVIPLYFVNPEQLFPTKSMGGKYRSILQLGKLEKREGTEFARTTSSIWAIRTRVSQHQLNQKNIAPTCVTVTYMQLTVKNHFLSLDDSIDTPKP